MVRRSSAPYEGRGEGGGEGNGGRLGGGEGGGEGSGVDDLCCRTRPPEKTDVPMNMNMFPIGYFYGAHACNIANQAP